MGNAQGRVTAQDRCASLVRVMPRSRYTDRQKRAILDLKIQRDKLHSYQRKITILTDRETEIAKEMLAKGDKKKALLALRRKKYQESLLAKTDAQLEQLEKLTSSVEFAQIQKDVVFGLQQGTKVLQEIHKEMGGIEHVEKLMGETADAIAYQKVSGPRTDESLVHRMLTILALQEVSEMLGGRISNADEDEVEDELAALEAEMSTTAPLPNVPDTELPVPQVQTDPEDVPAKVREAERRQMLAA